MTPGPDQPFPSPSGMWGMAWTAPAAPTADVLGVQAPLVA